jgi:phosphoribosylpyrophosphate synthetase
VCKDIEWNTFNDGFPNLFINNVGRMVKRDVIFLANFYPADKIFEQLAVINMLPRYMARRILVILPFFPTGKGHGAGQFWTDSPRSPLSFLICTSPPPGTMERVDEEGQIPTAVTLATLLSATPLCQSGPTQLMIYDIHVGPADPGRPLCFFMHFRIQILMSLVHRRPCRRLSKNGSTLEKR